MDVIFPRFEQVTGNLTAENSDWFAALFASVVIGRSNYIGIGFSTVIWKPLYYAINLSRNSGSQFFPLQPEFVVFDVCQNILVIPQRVSVFILIFRLYCWQFLTESSNLSSQISVIVLFERNTKQTEGEKVKINSRKESTMFETRQVQYRCKVNDEFFYL